MKKSRPGENGNELLVLNKIAIREGGRVAFRRTCWTWHWGEQWAILGPNGSGKSLLARLLCGRVPPARGEFRLRIDPDTAARMPEADPERSVVLLSPHVQRELAIQESSFYQARWHSGISEGRRTVTRFLSQSSVEDINPFEIGASMSDTRRFRSNRRRFIRQLGIGYLLPRKLVSLSNGEQRRVLLAHTLLRSPRMLILDDPFGGLDEATRARLKVVIDRLMRDGLPVLLITNRPEELPRRTTHLLLVQDHGVVAQGSRTAMLKHPLARQLARLSRQRADSSPVLRPFNRTSDVRAPRIAASLLVELNRVTVRLGGKRILDDITWTMRRGEHWALLGPNGSGKTTLLSLLQGDNPQAYSVDLRLFGVRPHSTRSLWQMRQRIGWASPELHLHYPPGWSCLDVVCSGFHHSIGLYQPCTTRQRSHARRWLRELGLADHADQAFGELSAGEQRLVLLARAVVKKPALLILDEPGQGLDAAHRRMLLAETDRVVERTGASLIFVTHHPKEMPACISHVLKLEAGRIASCAAKSASVRRRLRMCS